MMTLKRQCRKPLNYILFYLQVLLPRTEEEGSGRRRDRSLARLGPQWLTTLDGHSDGSDERVQCGAVGSAMAL